MCINVIYPSYGIKTLGVASPETIVTVAVTLALQEIDKTFVICYWGILNPMHVIINIHAVALR